MREKCVVLGPSGLGARIFALALRVMRTVSVDTKKI